MYDIIEHLVFLMIMIFVKENHFMMTFNENLLFSIDMIEAKNCNYQYEIIFSNYQNFIGSFLVFYLLKIYNFINHLKINIFKYL
jgi:hypothetical protein